MKLSLKSDHKILQEAEEAKKNIHHITYNELVELFTNKYPNGKVWKHGEMADTDVAIKYNDNSKVYNFNGTYDMVADKLHLIDNEK